MSQPSKTGDVGVDLRAHLTRVVVADVEHIDVHLSYCTQSRRLVVVAAQAAGEKGEEEEGRHVILDEALGSAVRDSEDPSVVLTSISQQSVQLHFHSAKDASIFLLSAQSDDSAGFEFESSRDSSAISEYFKYYAHLSQQQNMMSDYVRTATYRSAMLKNHSDFRDKVVLDVGAGSGLLSFFAAQAGARKVYAVEGSHMAEYARKLVANNNLSNVITVLQGKIEEVELPEQVDTIISEPLGIMLVNERMLESYVYARKWLKPGGKMFPTQSTLFVCPFSDSNVFIEAYQKASFWQTREFHGIDLTSLYDDAVNEYISQPCVEQVNPDCLVGEPVFKSFNYTTMDISDLFEIEMEFTHTYPYPVEIHGIASWFDNTFEGSSFVLPLSTSPYAPLTHWYQVRCLLKNSLFVQPGDELKGVVKMSINRFQSYDVHIHLKTSTAESEGHINLKEPNFRFGQYSSVPSAFSTDGSQPSLSEDFSRATVASAEMEVTQVVSSSAVPPSS
eukprot:m.130722 g.130722  ORF g.130722 m.130722 type:complete len:503 (+) comp15728_c0_seq2:125-1633(+)